MSEYWPHQFTKVGKPKVVGEEQLFNNTTVPVLAQEMACVHCQTKYTHNMQPQPQGPCPARSDKREMKRVLG